MITSGIAKKSRSQPSPGRSSRYGRAAFRNRAGMRVSRPALGADHLLERIVELLLLFRLEATEDERVLEERFVREYQLVVEELPVALYEYLLDALNGTDVVDVLRDVGLDFRPVNEVNELLGREGLRGAHGNLHVVRPEVPARLRNHELDVRVVGLELNGVAGPADDDPGVALRDVLRVLVAREASNLSRVGALADLVDRLHELVDARLLRVVAQRGRHHADGVAHLGEHRHLALVVRVEQVVHRPGLALHLVLAVDDPRDARLPGHRILTLGVERGRLEPLDQVLVRVRHGGLVELLDVAEADHARRHPVGDHVDVAAAGVPLVVLLADLAEELGVVVDLLDVLDLGPVLLLEVLEGAVVLLDIERPVGHVHRVRDLPLGDGLLLLGLVAAALRFVGAAGRQVGERRGAQSTGRAALEDAPPRERVAQQPLELALQVVIHWRHSVVPSLTMWMFSSDQLKLAASPAAGRSRRASASEFGTNTVMRVPSPSFTTICVAVPKYNELSTCPSTLGRLPSARAPASRSSSFSGRTTAWARSPVCTPPVSSAFTVGPASRRICVPAPLLETTSPGIRFETPMKPATKVVPGRS